MRFRKIVIIGYVGAGKTTFSQKIEKLTNFPCYHSDEIAYKGDGTLKIDKKVFKEKLSEILEKDRWIIEGVHDKLMRKAIREADLVIFLHPNRLILTKRVIVRSIKLKHSIKRFFQFIYWANRSGREKYEKNKRLSKRFVEIKHNDELELLSDFLDLSYKKLTIIGYVGEGKTTLANKLMNVSGIKAYHSDILAYKPKHVKRKEFKKRLVKVIEKDKWIFEGAHTSWMIDAIKAADIVLFLNQNRPIRTIRVTKRSIKRKYSFWLTLKFIYLANNHTANYFRRYKRYNNKFIEFDEEEDVDIFLELIKNV